MEKLRGQIGRDHAGPESEISPDARQQGRGDRAERPAGGSRNPEQGEFAAGESGDDTEPAKIRRKRRELFLIRVQYSHEE